MSAKGHGSFGPIFGAVLIFAALGCGAEELPDATCDELCQHIGTYECADPVDECVRDCEEYEFELPPECDAEWEAAVGCASKAEWSCDTTPCDPNVLEVCPTGPRLQGCEEETDALEACDPPDNCAIDQGQDESVSEDGRIVSYAYTSLCGRCAPTSSVGSSGAPCARAEDCEEFCCDCSEISYIEHVCIDAACAGRSEGCMPSIGACMLFQ